MIERYLLAVRDITLELGFPLLLGIVIAGLIHVLLPKGFVHRNFGGRGIRSVLKAALIGVPMPLCSCGVIPTAIGLKQDGASNGSATGFLISTPQTGVDSILVSASFLGWPFAIFKVVAAFVTGVVGGTLVDAFESNQPAQKTAVRAQAEYSGYRSRAKEAARFGVFELLGMIYGWIILGILVAALISVAVPPGYLSSIGWISGIGGLFLMLLIALPLYVCATASVPIAASLIAAGMPVGTALVFLMAGPASNVATIGAVWRSFGGKVLTLYLITVAVFSMLFGWFFDFVIDPGQVLDSHQHDQMSPLAIGSTIVIVSLFGYLAFTDLKRKFLARLRKPVMENMGTTLNISGMTCQHCAANVTRALKGVPGVVSVQVLLESKLAIVDGSADTDKLIESVRNSGYDAALPQGAE